MNPKLNRLDDIADEIDSLMNEYYNIVHEDMILHKDTTKPILAFSITTIPDKHTWIKLIR